MMCSSAKLQCVIHRFSPCSLPIQPIKEYSTCEREKRNLTYCMRFEVLQSVDFDSCRTLRNFVFIHSILMSSKKICNFCHRQSCYYKKSPNSYIGFKKHDSIVVDSLVLLICMQQLLKMYRSLILYQTSEMCQKDIHTSADYYRTDVFDVSWISRILLGQSQLTPHIVCRYLDGCMKILLQMTNIESIANN